MAGDDEGICGRRKLRRACRWDTVAVPLIGPTDVLVRVKTGFDCGTDLHIYGWDRWSQGRNQATGDAVGTNFAARSSAWATRCAPSSRAIL